MTRIGGFLGAVFVLIIILFSLAASAFVLALLFRLVQIAYRG